MMLVFTSTLFSRYHRLHCRCLLFTVFTVFDVKRIENIQVIWYY